MYIGTFFVFYRYVDFFFLFNPSFLLCWMFEPGHKLFWVSNMHVFYIFVFVLVQRN